MSGQNPYATPFHGGPIPPKPTGLPPADQKKIESVIKDAGQFWLAIILCVFCGIAGFVVPIWYTVRLMQWNKFAQKYPFLMSPNAAKGSLPAKFQSSQWKLIVGISFGGFILIIGIIYVALVVLAVAA